MSSPRAKQSQIDQDIVRADVQTRFQSGNANWKKRRSHGRPCRFPCPESLRIAGECYFQWSVDNPLFKAELVAWQGKATIYHVPVMRPFTLTGLYRYLGINQQTWANYRKRQGFTNAVERIETIIYVQKLEGAAAGIFNARIVAHEIDVRRRKSQARDKYRVQIYNRGQAKP